MSNTVGDITEEQLKVEYGMTEENAKKLLHDLPELGELAKEEEPENEDPVPEVPEQDQRPVLDKAGLNVFEKMSDEQITEALNFVDRYLIARDSEHRPEAGIRAGAMVGFRWPTNDASRELASFILFGAKTDSHEPSLQERSESFWERVTKTRDSMDKKIAADSSAASILPPPFFYEDEMNVNLDNGIVVEDGVLKANVSAAAAMVQEYIIDGKTVKILKDPEELRAAADNARMLPITNDHPPQRIVTDPDEIMGWTGLISYDEKDEKLRTTIEVTDEKTIKDVQAGKDNASIGFMCELDFTSGVFHDEDYDAIQRKIILNHLAIVDEGRCPKGKCGIGQDSKAITDSMTKEELIKDAKKAGCAGGDACKCGKHKSITVKDEDKEPEKKKGDAKMKHTLKEKDEHTHTVELDEDGNGESSTDAGHNHKIEAKEALEAGDPAHTHLLEEIKADEKEEKPEAEPEKADPETDPKEDANTEFALIEKDGHTHTAKLDEDGNGESSTDAEHSHKIEAKKVMEAGDPPHSHALEEVKEAEPELIEEDEEKSEEKDEEEVVEESSQAEVHEKLLKEKMDAITAIANEIATKGTTMSQSDLQAKISAMQEINWKLTELIGVIRSKDISVPSDAINAALKTMNDTRSIETTIAEIRSRHEVLVDEVMDFTPPSPREHYEAMDNRQLEEIINLLDSQSMVKLPGNDSSSAPRDEDGYKGKNITDAIQKKANIALGK